MIAWSRREAVKSKSGSKPGRLGLLAIVAVGCTLLLLIGFFGPVARAIRVAADWIDLSPNAPVVFASLLAGVALLLFGSQCFRLRRTRRPEVVRIRHYTSGIWEGQSITRITDPRTAQIRFVLHTRKKAG